MPVSANVETETITIPWTPRRPDLFMKRRRNNGGSWNYDRF